MVLRQSLVGNFMNHGKSNVDGEEQAIGRDERGEGGRDRAGH